MPRRQTVGLFALALICFSLGCSGGKNSKKEDGDGGGNAATAEHEGFMRDLIHLMNEYSELLESAKDKASAEKVRAKLDDIEKRFKDLGERVKKFKEPTEEQKTALATKFRADLEAATKRLADASEKLAKNTDAEKVLSPAILKITNTMQASMRPPPK
jgi:hypothetical protein